MSNPTITVRAIQPMVAGLASLGHDSGTIVALCGLDRYDLSDPEVRVPHDTMMAFWKKALDVTGDDCIALHVAESAPIESFELHAFALLASRDLREAWTRGVRYQRLIHDTTDLSFEVHGRDAILRHSLPGGRNVPRQPAEGLLGIWLRLARLIAGPDLEPRLVRFAHGEPACTTEHKRFFRAPLIFSSGMTALVIDTDYLDRPNPGADRALATLMERYATNLLRETPRSSTLSERLRSWLTNELRETPPSATAAARAMMMSVRSFSRALEREGTSYRNVLATLRTEMGSSLLIEHRCSLAEVAFLLGFSELSAFTRAFKRWTGLSPSEFREKHGRPLQ